MIDYPLKKPLSQMRTCQDWGFCRSIHKSCPGLHDCRMAKKVEVAMNAPIEKDDGMPLLHAEGCQSSCAKWVVVLIVAALLVLAGVLL